MSEPSEIEGCVDCAIAVANADYSGMDLETETAVRAGIERWGKDGYILCVDHEEEYFSWRHCNICCRPLGGTRLKMWAMTR